MIQSLSLALWALAESIFFPIPPDALLMALVLQMPNQWLQLGLLTTIGSLSGAIIGYLIGLAGGRPLLECWVKKHRLARVQSLFHKYDVWAIAIAGFTPLPYKVFALSAGVFQVRLARFLLASLLSRGMRFMLEAYLVAVYGATVIQWIKEYFDILSVVAVAVVVLGYMIFSLLRKKFR